jgi:hypothetical protein
MYVHIYHVCVCVCVYTYIHTYIYILHTHTHTHTHTSPRHRDRTGFQCHACTSPVWPRTRRWCGTRFRSRTSQLPCGHPAAERHRSSRYVCVCLCLCVCVCVCVCVHIYVIGYIDMYI